MGPHLREYGFAGVKSALLGKQSITDAINLLY